jgi:hypothetical protein
MAVEQVMSDRDSEDEVDDDVADFEDRRVCLMIKLPNTSLVLLWCNFETCVCIWYTCYPFPLDWFSELKLVPLEFMKW